jgi:hypothetical protein
MTDLTRALAEALQRLYREECVPPLRALSDASFILANPALRAAFEAALAEAVARDRARILRAVEAGPDIGDHEFGWKSYLRQIVNPEADHA